GGHAARSRRPRRRRISRGAPQCAARCHRRPILELLAPVLLRAASATPSAASAAMTFAARLDILPAPQRTLWSELVALPRHFVLYGGTALALRLGLRVSVDFDFFSC